MVLYRRVILKAESYYLSFQVFEKRVCGGWSGEAERRVHPGRRPEVSWTENHESPSRIK